MSRSRHNLVCAVLVAALAVGAPTVAEGARGPAVPQSPTSRCGWLLGR